MKIQKFNESDYPGTYIPSNEEEMIDMISDIIQSYVGIKPVQYSEENELEIDSRSVYTAASQIYLELKLKGVDFDLLYSTKKYNI